MKINLPEPHSKQKEVIYFASQESDAEFITVVAGRRAGKSAVLKQILIYYAATFEKLNIWFVTFTDGQVRDFFYSLYESINSTGLVKNLSQQPYYSMEFITSSKIHFKSSLSGDALRGGDGVDFLLVDESAYIKEDTFSKIILPQLATKRSSLKKKIILASSPRGKSNWLYKFYSYGNSTLPEFEKFKSVKFNIYDNPAKDIAFISNAKLTMTDSQFKQEILGEFVDSANVFNNINECVKFPSNLEPDITNDYYLGVDVGLAKDRTAYTIVTTNKLNPFAVDVVYVSAIKNQLSTQVEQNILDLNKKWKFKKIFIESNNSGLPILTNLINQHKVYNIEGFNTNKNSKSSIINQLIHLFNQMTISIPKNPLLIEELEDFIIKESNAGNGFMQYEGLKSDDTVMSLAIAVECWTKYKNAGKYFINVI